MNYDTMPKLGESFSESCVNKISDKIISCTFEENNAKLEQRLSSLKSIMENLRIGLAKERELWKKEVEEAAKLSNIQHEQITCTCTCEDSSLDHSNVQLSSTEPTLNDMSILDYEQKLSMYQQALAKVQVDKRVLRRHLAAHAYKRRLLELENMCNVELLRVKQNVQCLQPLQAIVSEWNFDVEDTSTLDDEITGGALVKKEVQVKKDPAFGIENIGNKSESKELVPRAISPVHSSVGTTSSLFPEEDDDALMMRRLQSVGWYWFNEKNNLPFNPLM